MPLGLPFHIPFSCHFDSPLMGDDILNPTKSLYDTPRPFIVPIESVAGTCSLLRIVDLAGSDARLRDLAAPRKYF